VTTLRDSIVTDTSSEVTIANMGTLNVLRSIIADNDGFHEGGGINNAPDGTLLVEDSTIANNLSATGGGILNRERGSALIRNSSIIGNRTDNAQPGGGIRNSGGSVEIVNSTIAKNSAGGGFGDGGGGIYNSGGGQVSITNSTIRENEVRSCFPGCQRSAGI